MYKALYTFMSYNVFATKISSNLPSCFVFCLLFIVHDDKANLSNLTIYLKVVILK